MYILKPQNSFVVIFLCSLLSCRVKPDSTDTEGSSVKVIGGSRMAIPVPEVPILKIMPKPNADYYWQSFGKDKQDDIAQNYHAAYEVNSNTHIDLYMRSNWVVKRIYLEEEDKNIPPKASGLLFTGYSLLAGDSGAPMVFPLDPPPRSSDPSPELVTSFKPSEHRIVGLGISCEVAADFTKGDDHKDCKDIKSINPAEEMIVNNFVDLMSPMSLMLFQSAPSFTPGGNVEFGNFYNEQLKNIPLGIPKTQDFFAGDTLFELKEDLDIEKIPKAQNGVREINSMVGSELRSCFLVERLSPREDSRLLGAVFAAPSTSCNGSILRFHDQVFRVFPRHCQGNTDSGSQTTTPAVIEDFYREQVNCQSAPDVCSKALEVFEFEDETKLKADISNLGFAFKSLNGTNIYHSMQAPPKCPFIFKSISNILFIGFNTLKTYSGGLVDSMIGDQLKAVCMHVGQKDSDNSCITFQSILSTN